jgi:hypothetical protein
VLEFARNGPVYQVISKIAKMREALSMPTGDTWIITRPKLRSPPATRGGQLMNTTKLDERALWESPTRKEKAKHVRKKIEGIEV